MTTSTFNALASATARAMAAVYKLHPARPAAPVRSSMRCTKCGGSLTFDISTDGRTAGRCSSVGCIQWRE